MISVWSWMIACLCRKQKYSYASHGLRFELRNPLENQQQFIASVNREAGDDEDGASRPSSGSER